MREVLKFLKFTIIGGVLFLLPIVVIIFAITKVLPVALSIVQPFERMLPRHVIAGIAVGSILTSLLLILVAFAAGLVSRTSVGQSVVSWVQNSVLGTLPQYQIVKSIADDSTSGNSTGAFQAVMVAVDGGWRLGFLADSLPNDWIAVFLPEAPHALHGSVVFVPSSHVKSLSMSQREMMSLMRHLGGGSSQALHGVDLTVPQSARVAGSGDNATLGQ